MDPPCPISELDLCPVEVRSKSFDQLHSGDLPSIHKGNAAPFRTRGGLLDELPFKMSCLGQLGLTEEPYVHAHA